MTAKFRFEKTQFGWRAYQRQGNAYLYCGHFRTQREARELLSLTDETNKEQK